MPPVADAGPERKELRRCAVKGEDGSAFTAIEYRYLATIATRRGVRTQIGARHWMLKSGQGLRLIDAACFLHEPSGELFWLERD
ncbi:hypothetical protein [Novosphingobium sp. TCA1]|jgi:hypothetical protein|uniref:hypothetical protein n=1 Tax=Novosphingobium sp. TCA1 TaxID=2682474 RepID=UPI00130990DF|nr:hypothetical protein [Novosphingobium sp. TCA1]GFE77225.1 hypothetical protein NTCA1_48740 [Novosphingobium sp. TCA1]